MFKSGEKKNIFHFCLNVIQRCSPNWKSGPLLYCILYFVLYLYWSLYKGTFKSISLMTQLFFIYSSHFCCPKGYSVTTKYNVCEHSVIRIIGVIVASDFPAKREVFYTRNWRLKFITLNWVTQLVPDPLGPLSSGNWHDM